MDFVFEVNDKTGREIRLTSRQWKHILDHGDVDVEDLENVKNALVSPSSLLMQNLDENKGNYYLYKKEKRKYLMVVVKYLNGTGFVITSFYVKSIKNEKQY